MSVTSQLLFYLNQRAERERADGYLIPVREEDQRRLLAVVKQEEEEYEILVQAEAKCRSRSTIDVIDLAEGSRLVGPAGGSRWSDPIGRSFRILSASK